MNLNIPPLRRTMDRLAIENMKESNKEKEEGKRRAKKNQTLKHLDFEQKTSYVKHAAVVFQKDTVERFFHHICKHVFECDIIESDWIILDTFTYKVILSLNMLA